MAFIGTHNHLALGSNLRIRDSINRIEDIIPYAQSLGHKGLVITEHESITSHLDCLTFHKKIKQQEGFEDWKTGLGNEIYLCSYYCMDRELFYVCNDESSNILS